MTENHGTRIGTRTNRGGDWSRDAQPDKPRLGIVGAGKLGITLARAALAAGYDVAIAGSGSPEKIELTVDVLAPGASAVTLADVVDFSDTIVLAIPTHRFRELPGDLFDGKVLVDAMNYWPDTDGADPELADAPGGSSALVRDHFPGARVVKSLNQMSYHQVGELPREPGAANRVAMAAVGDDRAAVRSVMDLIDALGFDPVEGGPLDNGRLLEPDGSPYAITYTAPELARRFAQEAISPRGEANLVVRALQQRDCHPADARQSSPRYCLATPPRLAALRLTADAVALAPEPRQSSAPRSTIAGRGRTL